MLKHGRIGITRPENFPKLFRLYAVETLTTESGRIRHGNRNPYEEVRCILSIAKPEETERFGQMGVTVTHSILSRGSPIAKEHDIFALVKNGTETRHFEVQAVHNKGEMGIDTLYYCKERGDRK